MARRVVYRLGGTLSADKGKQRELELVTLRVRRGEEWEDVQPHDVLCTAWSQTAFLHRDADATSGPDSVCVAGSMDLHGRPLEAGHARRWPWRTPRALLGQEQFDAYLDEEGCAWRIEYDEEANATQSSQDARDRSSVPTLETGNDVLGPRRRRWKDAVLNARGEVLAVPHDGGGAQLFPSLESFLEEPSGSTPAPTPVLPEVHIDSISTGAAHFLLLGRPSPASSGTTAAPSPPRVYAFHDNRFGQLGLHAPPHLPASDARSVPELDGSQTPDAPLRIRAGGRHSVAVMRSGAAYVWGWDAGQLGRAEAGVGPAMVCLRRGGAEQHDEDGEGEALREEDDVLDAGCGERQTVLVTREGAVWIAGADAQGLLDPARDTSAPFEATTKSFFPLPFFGPSYTGQRAGPTALRVVCGPHTTFIVAELTDGVDAGMEGGVGAVKEEGEREMTNGHGAPKLRH